MDAMVLDVAALCNLILEYIRKELVPGASYQAARTTRRQTSHAKTPRLDELVQMENRASTCPKTFPSEVLDGQREDVTDDHGSDQ